ncbi:MAG: hypothetical protein HUK20_10825 [Fibrobacter sp.]|nr:hypothetical protein [Fibrobacter sp.]
MQKLWLTTCPDDFAGEYDDIEEMFKRGLTRLILRKRRGTADDYERWLLSLPMEYRERIWVWGTPDTAERLDVRGCVAEAASLMGPVPESWMRVNCVAFCRSIEQVKALPAWVAGALLGPVYQPFSALEPVKALADTAEKMEYLTRELSCLGENIPIILYGGFDQDNISSIKKLPVRGVSVLGGVWNYADSVNALIKTLRAL